MINPNKIKLAIIGGGINSAVGYAHYCAINLSNKFEILTGNFSRNNDINKQSAQTYGISDDKLYFDYQTLFENEKQNIDAVVLLTPTNIHHLQILDAIKHKIPVICEKSLTSSMEEFENIKRIYNNEFISIVFNYPCYPILKELKKLIENDHIGKINQIHIEMPQEGFIRLYDGLPSKPQSWRLIDGSTPTISLDLGMHLYSIIKALTNETPIETICVENSFGNFKNIIDDVTSIIKYSNNIICNMWYSKSALGHRNGLKLRLYGSKGSAEWEQINPEYLKFADNSGKLITLDRSSEICQVSNQPRYNRFKVGHPAGYIEGLANFYEDVYQDLTDLKNNNTFGIKEYEECIKLFESMSVSSKNKCWVKI